MKRTCATTITSLAIVALLLCPAPLTAANVNYCSYGKAITLALVDRTTVYDDADRAVVTTGLEALVGNLQIGERVIIGTIGASIADARTAFDECFPGCPDSGFFSFNGCRAMIARGDRADFQRRLVSLARDLLNHGEAYKRSDIVATVARSTKHLASLPADQRRPLRRLFLFSDLIENSDTLPWSRFSAQPTNRSLELAVARGHVPAVRQAEVWIYGVGRFHDKHRRSLSSQEYQSVERFWRALFEKGGAAGIHIVPIQQ